MKQDDVDRELHQHDVTDVGQDVAEHARDVACADRLGRADVVTHRVLDELGADQAVDAGPAGEAEDQHDRADAAAEDGGEGEDQQDSGDRREDVVDPLEKVADLAAEETRERAEHGADRGREQGRGDADEDRDLRALDGFGKDVAAEAVAAEGQRRRPASRAVVWYFFAASAHS